MSYGSEPDDDHGLRCVGWLKRRYLPAGIHIHRFGDLMSLLHRTLEVDVPAIL